MGSHFENNYNYNKNIDVSRGGRGGYDNKSFLAFYFILRDVDMRKRVSRDGLRKLFWRAPSAQWDVRVGGDLIGGVLPRG